MEQNNDKHQLRTRSSTGTEGPTFGSPGDSNGHWPEAGGPPREFGSPRPRSRSNTQTFATPVAEDQGSAFRLDTGEENTASTTEQKGVVFTDQNRTTSARRSDGETMMPRGRRGTSITADRDHVRMSDGVVVQVLPTESTPKSPAGKFEPQGSENGAHVVNGPDIGTFASDSGGWAGGDPDDNDKASRKLEAPWVSKVGGPSNSDEQAPPIGQRNSLDRTPRVVTVSVKPATNQRPASPSAPEENTPASPQRQGFRAGNTNNISSTDISRRNDGVDSGETSSASPGVAAEHGQIPSQSSNGHSGKPSSEGSGASMAGTSIGGKTNLIPGPSAPVAAASQLGLEGDRFPDVSEFDLDDISEIDAGGEWAGSEGGSLSS